MNVILRNRAFPLLQARAFDSGFERLVGNLLENAPLAPRMNVIDTGAAYRIEAELPGVTREEIKISVDKKRVSVEAESAVANETAEGEKALLTERTSRKYSRALTLASEVDDAEAVAKFENGVLSLTLPKKAADQPRQITIQISICAIGVKQAGGVASAGCCKQKGPDFHPALFPCWRPQGDSNPCTHRERVMS